MYLIASHIEMTDAAQGFFVAATIPYIVGGGAHVLATLRDTRTPTYFTPVDAEVAPGLRRTTIRLRRMFGGREVSTPSMWRIWLGINLSHGLGIMTFGIVCLLVALEDFALVERIDGLQPLTVAFSVAFVVLAVRFWFWGPLLITGSAATCFTASLVLSA
jgi:hypothetical protein